MEQVLTVIPAQHGRLCLPMHTMEPQRCVKSLARLQGHAKTRDGPHVVQHQQPWNEALPRKSSRSPLGWMVVDKADLDIIRSNCASSGFAWALIES
jgi:hypothetical protein